jgi:hypothetical protein
MAWGLHRGDGRGHAGGGGRRSHESGLHYALNSCRDRSDTCNIW